MLTICRVFLRFHSNRNWSTYSLLWICTISSSGLFACRFPGSWIRGITDGTLISVAGIPCFVSSKDPKHQCKTGSHMLFLVVACCGSAIGVIFFSVALVKEFFVMILNRISFWFYQHTKEIYSIFTEIL